MGIAATNFTTARTPDNFKAWYAEQPAEATAYLQTVAVKTGNAAALNTLDQLAAAPPADPGAAIAGIYAQVDAAALGATQAARATTLGWEANGPPKEPPALTGRLAMENGAPVLQTPIGNFTVGSVNPVGANDVSAFTGRVVTVKGWPTAGWQPGGAVKGGLIAEEFAPGTSAEFVTGRVHNRNGEVFVDVRPDKQVKITDPALKAALAGYENLGLVLPGDAQRQGNDWVYSQAPEAYYILAGFRGASPPTPTAAGDNVSFNMELAHGKRLTCDLPKVSYDSSSRDQRHYFFGKIDGGTFKAKGVTPTAGAWSGAPVFQRGEESTKFLEYAVPVGAPGFTPEESKFAL